MPPNSVKVKLYRKELERIRSQAESPDRVKEMLKALCNCLPQFDIQFVCSDGVMVGCHQAVLCMASSWWAGLLRGRTGRTRTWEEMPRREREYVTLTGVPSGALTNVLNVLYQGCLNIGSNPEEVRGIKKAWRTMAIDIASEKDFCVSNNLNSDPKLDFMIAVKDNCELIYECSEKEAVMNLKCEVSLEEASTTADAVVATEVVNITPVNNTEMKRKSEAIETLSSTPTTTVKKSKSESGSALPYKVEKVHTCLICNGRTEEGRMDKEASNLSFRPDKQKRLKEHYSKHFYKEGKFKVIAPPPLLDDGTEDEFGKQLRYKCEEPGCWKGRKPGCGYKEITLHRAAEHGLFEEVVAVEEREDLRDLVTKLQYQL